MAITFPLALPNMTTYPTDLAEVEITNINAVAATVSPFTGQRQKQEFARNQLLLRAQTIPLRDDEALGWWGFFRAMRSGLGTFLIGDAKNTESKGTAATSPGAPLVAGGSQTGTALVIDGAPANQTGWLLVGDWIQLGSGSGARLYTVVEDVDTDSGGNATIEIRPELRSSPGDNDAVTVSNCIGVFELTEHPVFPSPDSEHMYTFRFSAIEVP